MLCRDFKSRTVGKVLVKRYPLAKRGNEEREAAIPEAEYFR